jgi:Flp pilus assembly protein TadG
MNIPRGERGQIPALTRVINRLAAWPGEDIETRPTGERSGAGCEGNALVEFALVLPLFMIIMTAIFTFGVAVMNQLTLSQAVDAGARHLALIRTSTLDPCADTATAIDSAAPTLTPGKIKVTISINGVTPSPQTGNSCTGAVTALQAAQTLPVTVTATYPCNLAIYGKNYAPSGCLLSATVTEYEY